MADKSKTKSKRGGARPNAGRKRKTAVGPTAVEAQPAPEPPPVKRKPGHPQEYPDELYHLILARMATGETASSICEEEGMPEYATVWRWKEGSEEKRKAYARAREDQQHAWADQIVRIADDGVNDYVEREAKNGEKKIAFDKEAVMRSALRVDTRKWLMARLAPKSYGDKSALELSGKDGAPLVPVINVTIGGTEPSSSS